MKEIIEYLTEERLTKRKIISASVIAEKTLRPLITLEFMNGTKLIGKLAEEYVEKLIFEDKRVVL